MRYGAVRCIHLVIPSLGGGRRNSSVKNLMLRADLFLTRIKYSCGFCGFLSSCDTIDERNNSALSTCVFVLLGEEQFNIWPVLEF